MLPAIRAIMSRCFVGCVWSFRGGLIINSDHIRVAVGWLLNVDALDLVNEVRSSIGVDVTRRASRHIARVVPSRTTSDNRRGRYIGQHDLTLVLVLTIVFPIFKITRIIATLYLTARPVFRSTQCEGAALVISGDDSARLDTATTAFATTGYYIINPSDNHNAGLRRIRGSCCCRISHWLLRIWVL